MSAAPNYRPPFSAGTLQQLGVALELEVTEGPDGAHAGLAAATERLCLEAREKQLGAEHIVLAVKITWANTLSTSTLDPGRTSMAYQRVIDTCLNAYFRD
jgi:hypothetical protein